MSWPEMETRPTVRHAALTALDESEAQARALQSERSGPELDRRIRQILKVEDPQIQFFSDDGEAFCDLDGLRFQLPINWERGQQTNPPLYPGLLATPSNGRPTEVFHLRGLGELIRKTERQQEARPVPRSMTGWYVRTALWWLMLGMFVVEMTDWAMEELVRADLRWTMVASLLVGLGYGAFSGVVLQIEHQRERRLRGWE